MPNEILSLGLPQDTVSAISHQLCARIFVAHRLSELRSLLEHHEVSCIVVSAASCQDPVEDVIQLLGHTPLTTRIILLCESPSTLNLAKLSSLGIKTLSPPYKLDDLVEKLRY